MPLAPKKSKSKAAEPKRSARSLVSSTADESSAYARMLILGMSKSGKTLLAASAPKPLIIDCGRTLATLAARKMKIPTITIVPETDRSPPGELNSHEAVAEVIQNFLYREGRFFEEVKRHWYVPETIILDHLNGLCSIMEVEITRHPPFDGDRKGNPQLERSDYNVIQRRLFQHIILPGFDLQANFICVSELKSFEEDSGRTLKIPALTGNAMSLTLAGQFNEVLYLYTSRDEEEGKKSAKARYFATAIPEKQLPYLGTRAIEISKPIENPTFEKLLKGG